jgi:hypothetical protein
MLTFKERLNNKPSLAVKAMVIGLKEAPSLENFVVNMNTFGTADDDEDICYGCAATVAIQKIAGVRFNTSNIDSDVGKAVAVKTTSIDLIEFERAIDYLRNSNVYAFLHYFVDGYTAEDLWDDWCKEELKRGQQLPRLRSDYKDEELADYEILASWLEDRGY